MPIAVGKLLSTKHLYGWVRAQFAPVFLDELPLGRSACQKVYVQHTRSQMTNKWTYYCKFYLIKKMCWNISQSDYVLSIKHFQTAKENSSCFHLSCSVRADSRACSFALFLIPVKARLFQFMQTFSFLFRWGIFYLYSLVLLP